MAKKIFLFLGIICISIVIALLVKRSVSTQNATTSDSKSKINLEAPTVSKFTKPINSQSKNSLPSKATSVNFDPSTCNIKIDSTIETISIITRYNETGNLSCKNSPAGLSPSGSLVAYLDKGLTSNERIALYDLSFGKIFFINLPNNLTTQTLTLINSDRLAAIQTNGINERQITIYNLPANLSAYPNPVTELELSNNMSVYLSTEDTQDISIKENKLIFYDSKHQIVREIKI